MTLPNSVDKATPAGSDSPSLGDDQFRALKTAIEDILGIADATNIAAAAFSITTSGLQAVVFQDVAGNPSATGRLGRNATALLFHDGTGARTIAVLETAQTFTAVKTFSIDDAINNAVTAVSTLRHTTTGAPTAGIGARLLFQGESLDESPSDFGAVDLVASDVTAGSEDTFLSILLRVAGRALDEKYRFQSTAGDGFTAIFSHAVTADRTYTLPDFDTTLGGVPRSQLAGLAVTNSAGDLTNDIDVAVGECADSGNTALIQLAAGLTKQLDAVWAVGTNAGMRASGAAIADTTYHIFLIRRPDTGVVDIAADTSATGANIAANTNVAYTQKHRIFSLVRTGGAIRLFKQFGDLVMWLVPISDYNTTNPGTSAITHTLSVPTGITGQAIVAPALIAGSSGRIYGLLTPTSVTDTAPSTTLYNFGALSGSVSVTLDVIASQMQVQFDTSAQVRGRINASGANDVYRLATHGYVDRRGRDD